MAIALRPAEMLKITSGPVDHKVLVLRLAGEVRGQWVEELDRACEAACDSHRAVVLDLAEVSFIDSEGVALFRRLSAQRIQITNCSLFAAEQLREAIHVER